MRFILLLFVLIQVNFCFAQQKAISISIDFQDNSFEEVLTKLESKTDFEFYYAKNWLPDSKFTKTYENATLTDILQDLFSNTDINFFIGSDYRVILTKNRIIYTELPENFLEKSKDSIKKEAIVSAPVFIEKQKTLQSSNIETVTIGRANKNVRQKQFTITGTVINALNNKPVPNIAVFSKLIGKGTITDGNGNYNLKLPPGLNLVETSLLGYESVKKNVIVYNDGVLNFVVNENFEQLDEVIVESDATQNINDTTTGSSKISSEDSKNIPTALGERDILKIATTLPGVTTAGEGASGFNVRGGKTDQNLILLEDAVIYNPSHFFGIFQALNPFAISDVNIYKGSIPVEYGGRLSSVFDINAKKPSKSDFKLEGSVGPITANLVSEIPLIKDKSGILVGGRGAFSDWVLRSLNDSELQNSQASFYDLIVKYDHAINEKNDLTVNAYYSDDKFSITSDSIFNYNNRLLSAKWNHLFNEKNTGSLIVNNSQYKFNIDFEGSTNANFSQRFQIDETEIKFKFNYIPNEIHNFSYGLSSKLYTIQPGDIEPRTSADLIVPLSIQKEKGLESAIFLADNFKVSERLQLDVGLRYSLYAALGPISKRIYENGVPRSDNTVIGNEVFENNEIIETYGGPEARVSARYLLNNDFSVKASFNNNYQYIQTLSNNTTVSPIDTWKLADTNIKPQQASIFSLGFYKNINVNEYEISLEGFYKKQRNILDFKTGAQLLLNEFVETEVLQGEGKAYGVEFLIRKNIGKFNGWLGYTYSRSFFKLDSPFIEEQVNDGDYFPSNFDKPHDISFVGNYRLSRRFSFSANFIYQTGRPVTFPVGNYSINGSTFVLYSDRNQFRIPDYYRLDLGINIEGNHKKNKLAHSFWNISVYNVLGRNNPYSVFFITENGEIQGLQSSIFAVPIPSITYNFRF